MKHFHIQLYENSKFETHLAWSLAQVMCELTGNFMTTPYCYFVTKQDDIKMPW